LVGIGIDLCNYKTTCTMHLAIINWGKRCCFSGIDRSLINITSYRLANSHAIGIIHFSEYRKQAQDAKSRAKNNTSVYSYRIVGLYNYNVKLPELVATRVFGCRYVNYNNNNKPAAALLRDFYVFSFQDESDSCLRVDTSCARAPY